MVDCFSSSEFVVEEASTCAEAFERFRSARPDIAIVDYCLPDGDALGLIPKLKDLEPAIPIIVITGYGTMEVGVTLIKAGAEQCLSKPLDISAFRLTVEKLLQNKRNRQKQIASKSLQKLTGVDPFLGESAAIRALALDAVRVASSNYPVVIRGET